MPAMKLDAATLITFDKASQAGDQTCPSGLLIAVATGGAWIFYFADARLCWWAALPVKPRLWAYCNGSSADRYHHTLAAICVSSLQLYGCPWATHFQAAMLDEDSLVVTYNDWRGRHATHGPQEGLLLRAIRWGDCVDCNACVWCGPAGIDIR